VINYYKTQALIQPREVKEKNNPPDHKKGTEGTKKKKKKTLLSSIAQGRGRQLTPLREG